MESDYFIKVEKIEKREKDEQYQFIISLPMEKGWYEHVNLIIEEGSVKKNFEMNHIKNEDGLSYFTTTIDLPTKAIYHYYFSCVLNGNFHYIKKKEQNSKNEISLDETWKLSSNFEVPEWAKGAIMYHIFIDRFNRGDKNPLPKMPRRHIHESWNEDIRITPDEQGIWNNDFYCGDLQGIIEKLDYIKSLGVTIIYLSPICMSQSNHRYDAADYEKVDPYAGCNEDLQKLCQKAHELGIKVVLDAVFNHTGNDSKYFNEFNTFPNIGAFQSPSSPYADFYKKHNQNGKIEYSYWWGMKNLPVCSCNSPKWQNYILGENGIIDQWFSLGIDGLRLDVADELSDEFIEGIRTSVKRNKKDGFIIGEVWKNPMRMNRGYLESGKGMDSVMNYLFIDALIRYFKYNDKNKLTYTIQDILREYPQDTINTLMNFTSTHDITRAIDLFACNEFQEYGEWAWNLKKENRVWEQSHKLTTEQYNKGKEIYKAYIFALAFFPGILSIFYGDEIGLQGMGNLANRRPYPWLNQDKELLEFFRKICYIRNKEQMLKKAELEMLDINDTYLLFERYTDKESALIAVNKTDKETSYPIPDKYQSSEKIYTLKKSNKNILPPFSGTAIFK